MLWCFVERRLLLWPLWQDLQVLQARREPLDVVAAAGCSMQNPFKSLISKLWAAGGI
jgi:hypothetical protein